VYLAQRFVKSQIFDTFGGPPLGTPLKLLFYDFWTVTSKAFRNSFYGTFTNLIREKGNIFAPKLSIWGKGGGLS